MSTAAQSPPNNLFLVCGLGSLGQYCVGNLIEFGVPVVGIDTRQPQHWEIPNLPEQLEQLLVGDCRQAEILEKAGIHQCRAVLLVTSDERVNIAAAFVARSLNPNVRLVVRSAQENLNHLLNQELGNFVAYEATQLPAASIAIAALGSDIQSLFMLDQQALQVISTQIEPGHRWCNVRKLHELQTSTRRLLDHHALNQPRTHQFYEWEPDERVQAGDTISYIEIVNRLPSLAMPETGRSQQGLLPNLAKRLHWGDVREKWGDRWKESSQVQRAATVSGLLMAVLLLLCMAFYKLQYPSISVMGALNVAVLLLFGNFDGVYAGLDLINPPSWWLYLFSILIMLAGTLFIGILYALLTERVLAARFQFAKRRPPVPKAGHIVIVGLGRVGQRVAQLLQDLKQSVASLHSSNLAANVLPDMPLVVGSFKDTLKKANIDGAKSILALTDDEVANLELGLMAKALNPNCNLVIRCFDERFTDSVSRLLPDAKVVGIYAQAAEVFVGAAFGENILHLSRLGDRTMLVTEYNIETTDTLCGYLLSEVAYGYGIVPILYQPPENPPKFMPSEDKRLGAGDRLIVLANIDALQRVEQGKMAPRRWLVQVEQLRLSNTQFDGMQAIARISGCDVAIASQLMSHLPGTLACPLYKHQALRLVRALSKIQIRAHLVNRPM